MNLSVELALEQPVEEKTGCILEEHTERLMPSSGDKSIHGMK